MGQRGTSEGHGAGNEDGRAAPGERDALTRGMYEELRGIAARMMAGERGGARGHTLQPTALVNEACLRIVPRGLPALPREEQLALAARVLKQVLIDHARARNAAKRGGGGERVRLDIERDVLADARPTLVEFEAVHGALEKLRALSERQAEVVSLRLFSGMTMEQIASVLGVSKRSAEGDWTVARAWLRRELASAIGEGAGEGA